MKGRRILYCVAAVGLFAIVIGRSLVGSGNAIAALPTTIVLDPPYGNMRFDPPPADAQAILSASQAVTQFESVDQEFTLPSDATAQLGLYTAAVGDGTYRYLNTLAWGFVFHQCEDFQHLVSPETTISCTRWLFLDANTGEMLEAVWQQGQ